MKSNDSHRSPCACQRRTGLRFAGSICTGLACLLLAAGAAAGNGERGSARAGAPPASGAKAASATPAPRALALGRLFFTRERRLALERQRWHKAPERLPAPAATLRIDGVVKSSAGQVTTWVNGVPYRGDMRHGVGLSSGDPARVLLGREGDAPLAARVGESVEHTSGKTTDALSGGRIVIRRRQP